MFMRGIRIGTLYKMLERTNESSCLPIVDPKTKEILSYIVDLTMLSHRRLGHIDEKGIHAMHSKGMVEGLPNFSFEFDLCVLILCYFHKR